jgi:hypothetical protein
MISVWVIRDDSNRNRKTLSLGDAAASSVPQLLGFVRCV